jgi:hypothetical protein
MLTDGQLNFVAPGVPLSLVAGAAVPVPSAIIDLLGEGVGQAPEGIIGNVSTFGAPDGMGVGGMRPELFVAIGNALAGAAGTTLKAALQGAPDTGQAGGFQPGTWQDIISQDNITLAQGSAGQVIFRSPWLPPFPPGERPRFLRLLFTPYVNGVPTGAQFTAGSISSALVAAVRDDQFNRFAARNYTVG